MQYSREELLALYEDKTLPSDFVMHPDVYSKKGQLPFAFMQQSGDEKKAFLESFVVAPRKPTPRKPIVKAPNRYDEDADPEWNLSTPATDFGVFDTKGVFTEQRAEQRTEQKTEQKTPVIVRSRSESIDPAPSVALPLHRYASETDSLGAHRYDQSHFGSHPFMNYAERQATPVPQILYSQSHSTDRYGVTHAPLNASHGSAHNSPVFSRDDPVYIAPVYEPRLPIHVAEIERPMARVAVSAKRSPTATQWFYKDPSGAEHGPFSSKKMLEWLEAGYFLPSLMLRREGGAFTRLDVLFSLGHPFVKEEPWFEKLDSEPVAEPTKQTQTHSIIAKLHSSLTLSDQQLAERNAAILNSIRSAEAFSGTTPKESAQKSKEQKPIPQKQTPIISAVKPISPIKQPQPTSSIKQPQTPQSSQTTQSSRTVQSSQNVQFSHVQKPPQTISQYSDLFKDSSKPESVITKPVEQQPKPRPPPVRQETPRQDKKIVSSSVLLWCQSQLRNVRNLDIATFVCFLTELNSVQELLDYIKEFAPSVDAKVFCEEFIKRLKADGFVTPYVEARPVFGDENEFTLVQKKAKPKKQT